VAGNDDTDTGVVTTPTSPPPSFRSRASSQGSRHDSVFDRTLADTFDADGSDSDEENDGDDRQRLMRGTPSSSSSVNQTSNETPSETTPADGRPAVVERRATHSPASAPTVTDIVYGGGSGSDGVFANLNARHENGEKLEEFPPVCLFPLLHPSAFLRRNYKC
jgi:hypothetical protein